MNLTEEALRKAAEMVLSGKSYVKGFRVEGLSVVVDIFSNSRKTSWPATINFIKSGKCIGGTFPHPGSLTPKNIADDIEAAIKIIAKAK